MWLGLQALKRHFQRLVSSRGRPSSGDSRLARLRESEQRLRGMFDHAAVGIVEVDRDDRIVAANERLSEILGYPRGRLIGKTIHEITHPDDRPTSDRLNAEVHAGATSADYEKRYLKADGTPVWVHVKVSGVRDSAGRWTSSVGTVEDISERKRAEEALRASERKYRTLAEHIPEVIARFDRTLAHTYVNAYGAKVYGVPAEAVIGKTNQELGMPADKVAFWKSRFEEVFASGEQRTVEFDFDSPSFGHRYFSSLFVPERDERGMVVSILAITRDVTEIKRAEAELRHASEILDLGDAFIELDHHYRIVRVNPQLEQLFRVPRERSVGRVVWDVWPETARPDSRFWSEYHRAMESRAAVQFIEHFAPLDLWASVSVYPTTLGGLAAFVRDITPRKREQEALRRSEEQRRLALRAADLGTWDFNLRTKEIDWDERFIEIYGVASGRMHYSDFLVSLVHPEDRSRLNDAVERTIDPRVEADTIDIEYRIIWRDGSVHWVHVRGEAIFEGVGTRRTAVRFVGTVADITGRKLAEEDLRLTNERLSASEAKFRSVFEQAAIGMGRVTFDDARWVDVNDAFCRMLGRTRAEMLRTPWPEMTHPDDVEIDLIPFRRMARGEVASYSVEKRFLHKRGHHVWARLNLSLVRDAHGRPAYEIAIIEDVTERKTALAALNSATERLVEADRRKNEFLAMLSHELRNPLAPIKNSLYILERAAAGGEQAKRAQEVIGRQVTHMTRLIEDLLDVTRISRGKIRLRRERVELRDLVRRAAEDHRSIFAAAGIRLEIDAAGDSPVVTSGDPTRLAQVVGNLLTNAAKFTPRGGRVELSLGARDGTAEVRVRDTGAGIAPELLNELFEPFVQADATLDRSKGGLGLGLALVKGLVELHAGTVAARSEGPGKGAEFVVRLPVELPAPLPARLRTERSSSGAARRLRVLLIEDNSDAAETLKEALEIDGHEVETSATGFDGMEKARVHRPDVVVCDLGLPGIDGFEVARRMKADPALRGAPLVALSGYAAPDDLERSREAGFVQHLAKPPDLALLERTLAEVAAEGEGGDGLQP